MANTTSDIASRSPRVRMQAGLEELAHIATRLAFIGRELNDVVVETSNEAAVYKARAAELEARDAEQHNLPRINPKQSDAERQLKMVRRAMQALLQELGPDDASESSPNLGHHRIASVPSTPRSVISHGLATPRTSEHPRRRSRKAPTTAPSSPMPPPTHSSVASAHATPKRSPSVGLQADQLVHPASSSGQTLDTTLDLPKLNLNDNWRMSTMRTPQSAHVICPIPFTFFQERLHLDEDTMYSLESLAHTDDLSFHVQIVRDMAFVHEPIAMDGPAASILFDFGTPTDNRITAEYITHNLPGDGIFHTFTFPSKKDSTGQTSWYYIGAHQWTIVPPLAVWQTLSEKSRKTIVTRLNKQCKDKYSVSQLRQLLQEGQLETFCVQVSSTSYRLVTEEFATNTLGYTSSKSMNM